MNHNEQTDRQPVIVRSAQELQRAHDVLVEILLNEDVRWIFRQRGPDFVYVKAAADVLCWALGHDHNTTFALNLKSLEQEMAELGYSLHDLGHLEERPKG